MKDFKSVRKKSDVVIWLMGYILSRTIDTNEDISEFFLKSRRHLSKIDTGRRDFLVPLDLYSYKKRSFAFQGAIILDVYFEINIFTKQCRECCHLLQTKGIIK